MNAPSKNVTFSNSTLAVTAENLGPLKQRILLLGDAGLSAISPLQASLQKSVERAKLAPEQTAIIMLGDNIYANGFPKKSIGQTEFDEEQLEDISHLEAQLQMARDSNAEMFIVPGNHDWYANQVDSQANFIKAYAKKYKTNTRFVPFQNNANPLPEILYREGISIVFIDSMWLLKADVNSFELAMRQLEQLLQQSYQQHPDNVILISAHHPVETVGPHGGYYTQVGLQLYEYFLELLNGENVQDLDSAVYQRLIQRLKVALSPYKKTVFAAGHEHSLQLFKNDNNFGPQYSLVSGAANSKKLTGVGINENSQFASSAEGFFEIDIVENGVLLKAYDIHNNLPVHQQWLWKTD
ncbi:metallophosphoesterase [Thalassotalea fonticola]|uniref:Metallophosphoesterase n=1 Tax=Thalassotalea fonticola TaxID=3065649 RepID=A0ABZ0GQD1_9GAMM|nr:metallophosphoesterase [Colwelliaceae bacterium S1-1]